MCGKLSIHSSLIFGKIILTTWIAGFEENHFNIILKSIVRAAETGEFFTVHFIDGNVQVSDDLAFPEAVAAKIVKFLFVERRKGLFSTVHKVSLADRSCRRQFPVCRTTQCSL